MANNVVVIGAGPGGYPAALKLKELGAEVTLIESKDMGGTCLNRGCIPSKTFLNIGHRIHMFNGLKHMLKENSGINFDYNMLDWERIIAKKAEVSAKLRTSLEKVFQSKKIEVIKGYAKFLSKNEISIQTLDGKIKKNFDYAIIATGTQPAFPPPFNSNLEIVTDSDRVFDLPYKPQKTIIVGAGVIGLEFACFFNSLGIDVTILELLPDMLPNEDLQVKRALRSSLEKRGIKFIFGKKTKTIEAKGNTKKITLDNGTLLEADTILVSTGRIANMAGMGLENIGLEYSNKGVKTDMEMRTTIPNIYAIGDVNGLSLLAHSATKQGEIVAENIMNNGHKTFSANLVPKCIYTWPEAASIGLNKEAAEASGIAAKTARVFNLAIGRALASDETEGFTQIVWDNSNDKIIGAQMLGTQATELIHIFALAIKLGLTRAELRDVIFAHPTMAEAIHEVLSK